MTKRQLRSRVVDLGERPSFWLTMFLFISLLILPVLETAVYAPALTIASYSAVLVFSILTSKSYIVGFALLIVTLPIAWATLLVDSRSLFIVHCLIGSGVLWISGGVIFARTVKTHPINIDSVFGAICAYLIFGLAWALSYRAIHTLSPSSLPIQSLETSVGATEAVQGDFSEFIYYSFVTMSTLGYGDITPKEKVTRTLSWVQSVTGQFYVAIVIAWLVNALPKPEKSEDD